MSLRFVIWAAAILILGCTLLTIGHCYYQKLQALSIDEAPPKTALPGAP